MPEFVVSPIDDEICLRLGKIITRWSVVEYLTSLLLGTVLMADQGAMLVLTNAVSASTQSKWIRALMNSHDHEAAQTARVAALLTRADDLRAERNEYVHGIWSPEGCEKGTSG